MDGSTDSSARIQHHVSEILKLIQPNTSNSRPPEKRTFTEPRYLQIKLPPNAKSVLVFAIADDLESTPLPVECTPIPPPERSVHQRSDQRSKGQNELHVDLHKLDEDIRDDLRNNAVRVKRKTDPIVNPIAKRMASDKPINNNNNNNNVKISNNNQARNKTVNNNNANKKQVSSNNENNTNYIQGGNFIVSVDNQDDSSDNLESDEDVTNNDNRKFVCKVCNESFVDHDQFWCHYKSHLNENKCDKCNKRFLTSELLLQHCNETGHEAHMKTCQDCNQKFPTLLSLNIHVTNEHNNGRPTCSKCGTVFADPQALTKHCASEHERTVFECSACGERFTVRRMLTVHARAVHGKKWTVECDECKKVFRSIAGLEAHKKTHRKNMVVGPTEVATCRTPAAAAATNAAPSTGFVPILAKPTNQSPTPEAKQSTPELDLTCNKCNLTCKNERVFKAHVERHEYVDKLVHKCTKCKRAFELIEQLNAHVTYKHPTPDPAEGHICEYCGRKYTRYRELKKHLLNHSTNRKFECDQCGFRFFTPERLKFHRRIHGDKKFLCQLCPMKFTDKQHLVRHQKAHQNTNRQRNASCVFHCSMCQQTFESPARLTQHYESVHPVPSFICVACDLSVTTFDLLKIHFREQHVGKVINCCRLCGQSFLDKQNLIAHRSKEHSSHVAPFTNRPKMSSSRTCFNCKRTFKTGKLYTEHLKTNPDCDLTPPVTYECSPCNLTFPTRPHLNTHSLTHEDDPESVTCQICEEEINTAEVGQHLEGHDVTNLTCLECCKEVTSQEELQAHMTSVHAQSKNHFTCEICGKVFQTRYGKNLHSYIHTGEKPFSCDRCGESFNQQSKLKTHQLAHDGRKMYECAECGKTFWAKSSLLVHLRHHATGLDATQPSSHECEICHTVFKSKSNLINHLRKHKGEKGLLKKRFPCDRCKKAFSTKAHLIIHKQSHEGIGLVCPVCAKPFTTLAWLQYHMRVHTGESPTCHICGKAFTIQRSLEEHMATHDTDKPPIQCATCGATFQSQRGLEFHKLQCETDFRPAICRLCGLGFVSPEAHDAHAKDCKPSQNRRTTAPPVRKNYATHASTDPPLDAVEVTLTTEEYIPASESTFVISQDNTRLSTCADMTSAESSSAHDIISKGPSAPVGQLIKLVTNGASNASVESLVRSIETGEEVLVTTEDNTVIPLEHILNGFQLPPGLIVDNGDGNVCVQLVFQAAD